MLTKFPNVVECEIVNFTHNTDCEIDVNYKGTQYKSKIEWNVIAYANTATERI